MEIYLHLSCDFVVWFWVCNTFKFVMRTRVLECVPGVIFPRVNQRPFETANHLHLRRFRNKWNNAFTLIICLLGVHSNHLTYLHLYRKIHVILFSGTLAILWKATVIMAMSDRLLFAWNIWAPTGRSYMKCDIWTFLKKSRKFNFH
jgi:hypothetical protein